MVHKAPPPISFTRTPAIYSRLPSIPIYPLLLRSVSFPLFFSRPLNHLSAYHISTYTFSLIFSKAHATSTYSYFSIFHLSLLLHTSTFVFSSPPRSCRLLSSVPFSCQMPEIPNLPSCILGYTIFFSIDNRNIAVETYRHYYNIIIII